MYPELGLDGFTDLADREREGRVLKWRHHRASPEPTQIPTLVLVTAVGGEFGREGIELFARLEAVQDFASSVLVPNQDMPGLHLLAGLWGFLSECLGEFSLEDGEFGIFADHLVGRSGELRVIADCLFKRVRLAGPDCGGWARGPDDGWCGRRGGRGRAPCTDRWCFGSCWCGSARWILETGDGLEFLVHILGRDRDVASRGFGPEDRPVDELVGQGGA